MDMTAALTVSAVAMATLIIVNRVKLFYATAKVKALIANGGELVIVDVRTKAEHEEKRIAGSINVPLDQIKSNIRQFVRDETVPVAVYCLSGGRASSATKELKSMGFKTVVNLGGVNSWKGAFESGKVKKSKKA
ncbi:MAG: rhodanese-like domain-containing protein [Treponemataceae bacterium]